MSYLISAQNAVGTGRGGTSYSMYWSNVSYVHVESSGNSASATLLASPNGVDRWMAVTSWALGVNATATAQIASFFPFVMGRVDWVSGDALTGTVTMQYVGRLQGA